MGEGKLKKDAEEKIKKYELTKNFIFTGKIKSKDVVKKINESRICIAPYNVKGIKKGNLKKYGFYFSPLKIFEYMGCGKPIVATNYNLITKVLPKNNKTFTEGNVQEMADKIIGLLEDKNIKKIGKENLKESKKYTWKQFAIKLEKEMKKVIC
jgi:glycosyltransferase involved in cell wall biosynthesis